MLDRKFNVAAPNQVWAGDFTYVATEQGWLYLAVVIDLFSRRIVGGSMREDMRSDLVIDALRMAWFERSPDKAGLLFHSDRGSQYASHDYQELLKAWDITVSMSRVGNCWDNAMMESFFGSFKTELVYHEQFKTKQQARSKIIAWIEGWYNRRRRHSALNYQSPEMFEAQLN